ncbi:Uncharacterized protein CCMA1212_006407 [Trichoderma ghanense]|uniref:Uncharacterized protein n=1 Tax=Trichoderma ghanense TaxID=65468 RepID=A0ABY2H318_9HYPO
MAVIAVKLVALLAAVAAVQADRDPILPFHESARANANRIFNAIHSAGRQWGSSLNHNGFGFIPVVVPAGTSFYHGGYAEEPPRGIEWLAFEVEHAEFFARPPGGRHGHRPPCPGEGQLHLLADQAETDGGGCDEEGRVRGYLQTYHTTRDAQLLYLDGTSAGKTLIGTLDSQDEVLRQDDSRQGGIIEDEMKRAKALCDMVTEWGWDGIMRMEAGFEVIYCNFSSGLHLDSSLRTLLVEDRMKGDANLIPLWLRAAAERYDGIGGDRVRMDFSSMVSGFFFPINISSTDPERPDLVRLGAAKREHLQDIKAYLQSVFVEPRKFVVNWQAVVDMIVARFDKRLAAMASTSVSPDLFISELEGITLTYYEAPGVPGDITLAREEDDRNRTAEAIDRCAAHYLRPASPRQQEWTLSDALIHTSLTTVTQRICSDLFLMRAIFLGAVPDAAPDAYLIKRGVKSASMKQAVDESRAIARNLVQELAWTTRKKPQVCSEEEILLTAMWPFGDSVDHFNPGCVPFEEATARRRSYWQPLEQRPYVE